MNGGEKIAVVGAGALGILYGQKLTAAYGKSRVFFQADSERIARYQKEGFFCNGEVCDFSYTLEGSPIMHAQQADALRAERYAKEDGHEKVDIIIFAVKFSGLSDALEQARHLVSKDTAVISVLNGISSEEMIAEAYGREHVLHCVAQGMDAVKEGNRLTYQNSGILVIGTPDSGKTMMLRETEALLTGAGISCMVVDDIMYRMWSKLMMNTGLNQVSAVFGIPYGGVQTDGEARKIMIDAMEEVRQVAAFEGITLTRRDIDGWLDLIDSLNPEGMPSMRQDTKAGRKTEVELFSGTIRALGIKHHVPTPVNDFLYGEIYRLFDGL